jgi:hypothetical protein
LSCGTENARQAGKRAQHTSPEKLFHCVPFEVATDSALISGFPAQKGKHRPPKLLWQEILLIRIWIEDQLD